MCGVNFTPVRKSAWLLMYEHNRLENGAQEPAPYLLPRLLPRFLQRIQMQERHVYDGFLENFFGLRIVS
jgi:hypothetical protein